MIDIRCCLAGALAVSVAALLPAHAAEPKKHQPADKPATAAAPAAEALGTSAAWTAYVSKDKTGKVCYLVGEAQKASRPVSGANRPRRW